MDENLLGLSGLFGLSGLSKSFWINWIIQVYPKLQFFSYDNFFGEFFDFFRKTAQGAKPLKYGTKKGGERKIKK